MYGFLKMPRRASLSEKKEYKKHMCALCDSLHENYGIRGRLFVNYDSITLALLISSLDESLGRGISEPPERLCLRPLKPKKAPSVFRFASAISIMLGYSKFLDKSIDEKKRMPKWITELADSASNYLLVYGLDKSFFESKLREQHKLEEKECNSIKVLSRVTSEITSKIFEAAGKIADKPKFCIKLRELGFEVGRMIYVYDGLLDYHKDLRNGSFNCIRACYFRDNFDRKESIVIERVSEKISDFLKATKYNISVTLDEMELKNTSLLKRILLQSFKRKQTKRKTCAYEGGNLGDLPKQAIYGMLAGVPMHYSKKDPCAECWRCWWNDLIMKQWDKPGCDARCQAILLIPMSFCCFCAICSALPRALCETCSSGCGDCDCDCDCGECCCGEGGIPVRPPRSGCCR